MKSLVITGVSSGIGFETAQLAIERGARVFGSVRQAADSESLTALWGEQFVPLQFDVRDEAAVRAEASRVRAMLGDEPLLGLVCNAGIGTPGPILHQPLAELREQLDVDLYSVFVITQIFAPLLGTDPSLQGAPGRLVLMSSIGGFLGQPFASAYIASKHGIEGFADTVRREFISFGIDVIVVAPAIVATPIWDKIERLLGRYAGTPYAQAYDRGVRTMVEAGRRTGLAPQKVADVVWRALTDAHPRRRYSPAAHPLLEQALPRIAPRGVVDWAFSRYLRLKSGASHRPGSR
jgi:NAD(P)-dependent dehydrogenase (short-subunit alcohol dehydrogenase family)